MDLLVVRHAIAMERDAKRWVDDRFRPLSPRGMARGVKAAYGLRKLTAVPAVVLASPLLRAHQTARILERYARWPRAKVCAELAPDTPPRELLFLLAGESTSRIALVGHEPQLGALLALCLSGSTARPMELRKMGVALLSFEGRAHPARGRLRWFANPKLLRAARGGAP